jgi:hypothetical protein
MLLFFKREKSRKEERERARNFGFVLFRVFLYL